MKNKLYDGIKVLSRKSVFLNIPLDNRQKFLKSIDRLLGEHVDVFVWNHVANNNTDEKIKLLGSSDVNPFINPDERKAFLLKRRERIMRIITNNE